MPEQERLQRLCRFERFWQRVDAVLAKVEQLEIGRVEEQGLGKAHNDIARQLQPGQRFGKRKILDRRNAVALETRDWQKEKNEQTGQLFGEIPNLGSKRL